MSLINDALKRARQHQPPAHPPAESGDTAAPMRPVEPSPRGGSNASPLIVVLILVVLMLAGGLFYLAGRSSGRPPAQVLNQTPASQATSRRPENAANQFPLDPRTSTPTVGGPVGASNIAIPKQAPPEPVVAAAPPAPTIVTQVVVITTNVPAVPPVALKLQGIFYRPSNPSAVINGKTLFIGERLGDVRVLAITQTTVSVLQAGQTNVLTLE